MPAASRRQPLAEAGTPEKCQAHLPSRRVAPRGGMTLRSGRMLWSGPGGVVAKFDSSASAPELSRVSATSASSCSREAPLQDTKLPEFPSAGALTHEAHNETASSVSTSISSADVSSDGRDGGVVTSAASTSLGIGVSRASRNASSVSSDPFLALRVLRCRLSLRRRPQRRRWRRMWFCTHLWRRSLPLVALPGAEDARRRSRRRRWPWLSHPMLARCRPTMLFKCCGWSEEVS